MSLLRFVKDRKLKIPRRFLQRLQHATITSRNNGQARGWEIEALNPKTAAFFLAFILQFAPAARREAKQSPTHDEAAHEPASRALNA